MDFSFVGENEENQDYVIMLQKKIGEGAYGQVYECIKKSNPKEELCAKIIKIQRGTENQSLREQEIINKLAEQNNLNLVKTYFCKYYDKTKKMYVIMEKCQSNLQAEMKKGKKYSEDEVLDIFKQIVNGYKPMFETCIVHRDLKPENILIQYAPGGKCIYKISDFGIGKICGEQDMNMTKIGTPVYASPECNQFLNVEFADSFKKLKDQGKKNYKSQADVYSLGILMYQIALNKLPFPVQTPQDITIFVKNLNITKFTFSDSEKYCFAKTQILNLLEQMIVFWPHERINFEEICQKLGLETAKQPFKAFSNKFGNNILQGALSTNFQNIQGQQQVPILQQNQQNFIQAQQQQQIPQQTFQNNVQGQQQYPPPQQIQQSNFQAQQQFTSLQQPQQQNILRGTQVPNFNQQQQQQGFRLTNANPGNFPTNNTGNTNPSQASFGTGQFSPQVPQVNPQFRQTFVGQNNNFPKMATTQPNNQLITPNPFSLDSTQKKDEFSPVEFAMKRYNEIINMLGVPTKKWYENLIEILKNNNLQELKSYQKEFYYYFPYEQDKEYTSDYLKFLLFMLYSFQTDNAKVGSNDQQIRGEISRLYNRKN